MTDKRTVDDILAGWADPLDEDLDAVDAQLGKSLQRYGFKGNPPILRGDQIVRVQAFMDDDTLVVTFEITEVDDHALGNQLDVETLEVPFNHLDAAAKKIVMAHRKLIERVKAAYESTLDIYHEDKIARAVREFKQALRGVS